MIQISKLLIFIIQVYQKFSSRSSIRHCRFYPTCSQYFVEALQKYGFFKGSYLGIRRILKCHPFHPGGYDPLK